MNSSKVYPGVDRRSFLVTSILGLSLMGERSLLWGLPSGEETSQKSNQLQNREQTVFPDFYNFKLAQKFQRGTESYTQGFFYEFDPTLQKGVLYESGGRYGRSLLRKVDADTGKTIKQVSIPSKYFAEGLASIGDRLYLLTWREKTCLVYDKNTFEKIDEFRYRGEGWGLAFDGKRLAMSDGTSKVRFLDPEFHQLKTIDVHFLNSSGKRRSINNINELEFVNGELWANVYQQEYVIRIDPNSGLVLGEALNFSALVPKSLKNSHDYVLNGLAFNKQKSQLYVTGKCWPIVYVFNISGERKVGDDETN